MHYRYSSLLLATVCIGFLLAGCEQNRIAQCNKLNLAINKSKSLAVPENAAELNEMADSLDKLVVEVQAIAIEDQRLKDFQTRIIKMYSDVSQASRQISKAAKAKNRPEFNQSKAKAKAAISQELVLVEDINKYCAANS